MALELVMIVGASEVADLVRNYGYTIKESFDEDVVQTLTDTESVPAGEHYSQPIFKASKTTTRQVLARVRKFVMVADGTSEIAAMTKELEALRLAKINAESNLKYSEQKVAEIEKRLTIESAARAEIRADYDRESRERRALCEQLKKIEATLGKAKAAFGEIEWAKAVK